MIPFGGIKHLLLWANHRHPCIIMKVITSLCVLAFCCNNAVLSTCFMISITTLAGAPAASAALKHFQWHRLSLGCYGFYLAVNGACVQNECYFNNSPVPNTTFTLFYPGWKKPPDIDEYCYVLYSSWVFLLCQPLAGHQHSSGGSVPCQIIILGWRGTESGMWVFLNQVAERKLLSNPAMHLGHLSWQKTCL